MYGNRDTERQAFLQELLRSYGQWQDIATEAASQLQEANKRVADAERTTADAQQALHRLQGSEPKSSFALVLVDGDDYIFDKNLVCKGIEGGEEAADHLRKNINHYFRHANFDGAINWRILVRIYLNIDGLSKRLRELNHVPDLNTLRLFMIGLTQNQPLFDVVDVGHGKHRTEQKVKEMFNLLVFNRHCKHIILGCSNDRGCIPMLDPYKNDLDVRNRITLLQTDFVAKAYESLPFATTNFMDLLRSSNTLKSLGNSPEILDTPATPKSPVKPTLAISNAERSPTTHRSPENGLQTKEEQKVYLYPRPILVNAQYQRVDPPLDEPNPLASKSLNDRIKTSTTKPCNAHNLLGTCRDPGCTFSHFDLPPEECLALARKARTAVCNLGSVCTDPRCMFAHGCPFITRGVRCPYGDECKFGMFHDVDPTPVRALS